jgi:hypothetical protein
MPESLTDSELQQMIERDLRSADGIITPDPDVFHDRHRLLEEVQRLRALPERNT